MARYLVMVPEFRWDGRMHSVGDSIEALDTMEIRANVILGRLTPHSGLAEIPQRQPESAVVPALPAEQPPPIEEKPPEIEHPSPSRRRYIRRDLESE